MENDRYIMNDLLTFPSSLPLIKKLHACRLYLRVIFLINITNLKSDFLLPNIMTGICTKYHKKMTDHFKKIQNDHSWKLWKKTIRLIYYILSSINTLKHQHRLKRWTTCAMIIHCYQY